ncbi:MAG TPA: OmpA family protein [Rhizomicrobium sp.]|nr:OmpA family protein [Rhizomicrobium sp.]
MKSGRILGIAAIAVAEMWSAGAIGQADSTAAPAAPVAGDGVIHLHMPGEQTGGGETIHLHPIHHAPEQAEPAATDKAPPSAAGEAPTSAQATAAPVRAKAPHAGSAVGKPVIPFNFGEDDTPPPADTREAPRASLPPLKTASIPPHAAAPAHASSSDDEHAGLSKHGAVLFEKGATDPSPAQFQGVKLLAGDLTSALESGASRIQLEAYGGAPGDKSSDARRLSLKRALAVRQLLIDNGVPSNRIDVRAMGGVDDKGPADRVDVFVRAG